MAYDLLAMSAELYLHGSIKQVRKNCPNGVRGSRDIRDKLGSNALTSVTPTPRRKPRGRDIPRLANKGVILPLLAAWGYLPAVYAMPKGEARGTPLQRQPTLSLGWGSGSAEVTGHSTRAPSLRRLAPLLHLATLVLC